MKTVFPPKSKAQLRRSEGASQPHERLLSFLHQLGCRQSTRSSLGPDSGSIHREIKHYDTKDFWFRRRIRGGTGLDVSNTGHGEDSVFDREDGGAMESRWRHRSGVPGGRKGDK
ncbi:MAG: hypothetical protein VW338_01460 [Rhodospirillaceae bacterium]